MATTDKQRVSLVDSAGGDGDSHRKPPVDSALGMEGLEATLDPEELVVELYPAVKERLAQRMSMLWHEVMPLGGMTVRLTSSDERVRIARLTVTSKSAKWSARWARWKPAYRQAPELLGGSAVDAQDALSEDRTVLTLLVLPGETREAGLDFAVPLEDGATSGYYGFDVLITNTETREFLNLPGCLELTHPYARFLSMLPAIYREPAVAPGEDLLGMADSPFFARFLRGFQDFTDPFNQSLEALSDLFGAHSTPSDFVPWLAQWVALVLDDNWPEMKRRRLVAEAVQLYRWRGTRKGLARYLEIYAGVTPEINDQPFKGWRLGPDYRLGDNTVLGDVPEHTFVVTIAVPDPSAINEQIIRDIIEAEKPAHTGYSLRIVRREMQV
jgi:phage tail-like protein